MSRQAEVQGARARGLSSPGSSRGSGFSGRGDRGSGTGETAPGWPLASRSLRVLPASSPGEKGTSWPRGLSALQARRGLSVGTCSLLPGSGAVIMTPQVTLWDAA